MPNEKKASHGQVQNIYRIVNDGQEDVDLTRRQAIRTYQQLRAALYPFALRKAPRRRR